jgi:hypothetical protein
VLPAEVAEMSPQARPLALPAADADVDVVALREDPPIPSGDRAQLDRREPAKALLGDWAVGDVALERNAVDGALPEAERASRRAVCAVGADEGCCSDPFAVDPERDPGLLDRDVGDLHSVAEVGAGSRRLLGQVVVEASPLGHQDEGLRAAPGEGRAVTKPQLHPVDHVLDDRIHLETARQLPDGTQRQAAAARLVARKTRLVDEEHARPRPGQPVRARRACGPGTDDDRVEAHHETNPMSRADRRLGAARLLLLVALRSRLS